MRTLPFGVPVVAQRKRIWLGTMRLGVWSQASLSGLRIWHCRELWYRLQTQVRSGVAVAVAVASSYSSDLTPSMGTSICRRCSPKKAKKKKREREHFLSYFLIHAQFPLTGETKCDQYLQCTMKIWKFCPFNLHDSPNDIGIIVPMSLMRRLRLTIQVIKQLGGDKAECLECLNRKFVLSSLSSSVSQGKVRDSLRTSFTLFEEMHLKITRGGLL